MQLKQTSDESRLKQIENVLSKLDADKDGAISVDEVLKVKLSEVLLFLLGMDIGVMFHAVIPRL